MAEQRARFVAHQTVYNGERLHEALGQRTPHRFPREDRGAAGAAAGAGLPGGHRAAAGQAERRDQRGESTVYSDVLAGDEVGLGQEPQRARR